MKAKKHQPNVSLNKLIDLGEFEANTKLSRDNLLKNVAMNFKQARARMRGENLSPNQRQMISQTANLTPIRKNKRFDLSHERNANYNSLSPINNARKEANFNSSAKGEWQKTVEPLEAKSPFRQNQNSLILNDTTSQSSTYSLNSQGKWSVFKKGVTTPTPHYNKSRQPMDPMCTDAEQNPFLLSSKNAKVSVKSSI